MLLASVDLATASWPDPKNKTCLEKGKQDLVDEAKNLCPGRAVAVESRHLG
jgi:hypothetical protein